MATRYEKPFAQKPLVQNLLGKKFEAISDASDTSFLGIIKAMIPSFLTSYLGNYNSEIARRKDAAIQEVRDNFLDAQDAVQENIDANEVFRKELNLFTNDRRTWEKQTGDKIWEASPLFEFYEKPENTGLFYSKSEARRQYLANNMPREFQRVQGYKDKEFIAQPKSFFTKRDREKMNAEIAAINNDPQYRGALFNIASKIGEVFKRDGMSDIDATTESKNIVQEGIATDEVPKEVEKINIEKEARGYTATPYSSTDFNSVISSNTDLINNLDKISLNNNYFQPNIDAMETGISEINKSIGTYLNDKGKVKDEYEDLTIQYTNKGGGSDIKLNPFALFEKDPDIKLQIRRGGNVIEHEEPRGYLSRVISVINNGGKKQLNAQGIPINNDNAFQMFFNSLRETGRGYFDGKNTFVIDLPNTSELYLERDEILNLSQDKIGANKKVFNVILGNAIKEQGGVHDLVSVIQKVRQAEINMYQQNALEFMRNDDTFDKGQNELAKVEAIKARGPEEESEAVLDFFMNSYRAKDIENLNVVYGVNEKGELQSKTILELSRDRDFINDLLEKHEEKFGADKAIRDRVNLHFQGIAIDKNTFENMGVELNSNFVTDHHWQTGTNYLSNIQGPEMAEDINAVLSTLSTEELAGLAEMNDKEIFEKIGLKDFSYDKYEGLKNTFNSVSKYVVSGGATVASIKPTVDMKTGFKSGLYQAVRTPYASLGSKFGAPLTAGRLGVTAALGTVGSVATLAGTVAYGAYSLAENLIRQRNPFKYYIKDYFEASLPTRTREVGMTVFTGQDPFVTETIPFRGKAAPVPQEFFDDLAVAIGIKNRVNTTNSFSQALLEQESRKTN